MTPEEKDKINKMKNFKETLKVSDFLSSYDTASQNAGTTITPKGGNNMDEKQPKNIILYGPPGTGKTYGTVKKAMEIIRGNEYPQGTAYSDIKKEYEENLKNGRIQFVTFHQSYSYEDFIEGIKAETEKGKIKYRVKDGVFKAFCGEADPHCIERSAKDKEEPTEQEAPAEQEESIERKEPAEQEDTKEKTLPDERYVFIIDEINRGNISKIFGELITLIEETKREGEDEAMRTTLPYSRDVFSVPSNVYIIGTMNTADRSIAVVDTALRRRFTFEEMMPQPQLVNIGINDGKGGTIKINELLTIMNNRITALYDREHTIGHSFFMKLTNSSTIEELGNIFKNKIIPLLQEYFYEDYEKIRLVLGDNRKDENDKTQFILVDSKTSLVLFGKSDVLDEDAKIYIINNDAFIKPEAYRYLQNESSSSGVPSGGSSTDGGSLDGGAEEQQDTGTNGGQEEAAEAPKD